MHKDMLRNVPTKEFETPFRLVKVKVRAFKVGDGKYILHKFGPDKIGLMTNFITTQPVSLDEITNLDCRFYEEIEY